MINFFRQSKYIVFTHTCTLSNVLSSSNVQYTSLHTKYLYSSKEGLENSKLELALHIQTCLWYNHMVSYGNWFSRYLIFIISIYKQSILVEFKMSNVLLPVQVSKLFSIKYLCWCSYFTPELWLWLNTIAIIVLVLDW